MHSSSESSDSDSNGSDSSGSDDDSDELPISINKKPAVARGRKPAVK